MVIHFPFKAVHHVNLNLEKIPTSENLNVPRLQSSSSKGYLEFMT